MSIRSTFKAKEPPISHDGPKVKVLGKRRKDFFSTFIPSILQLSAPALIFMSFVIYICCTLFFAFLFYAQGADCFVIPTRPTAFHYEAFWLSVQTFSTVGFGSIYPICFSGHLVVVFECFSSLIVTAILGGAIFFNVMLPRSRIRFSKQALVDVDVHPRTGTSYKMITFRLVRESDATMRDANIRVQARFIAKGTDGEKDDSQLTELKLKSSYYNLLEHWQVCHTIDERSPLWPVRDNLPTALSALEVSIVFFDVAYNQDVRRFHAYSHRELVFGATFDVMVGRSLEHGKKLLEIRHDKLDSYTLHINPSPAKPPPRSLRLLLKRGARVEADDAHKKAAAPSAAPAGVQPRVQRVQVAPDGVAGVHAGEAVEVKAKAFSTLTPVVSLSDSEAGSSPRTGSWTPRGADAREAPDARAKTC